MTSASPYAPFEPRPARRPSAVAEMVVRDAGQADVKALAAIRHERDGGSLEEARTHFSYLANSRNLATIALHARFGFEELSRDFWSPGVTFTAGKGILLRAKVPNPAR